MYVLLNNLNSLSKSFVTNMFNVFDLLFMKWLSSGVTGTHSLNFSPFLLLNPTLFSILYSDKIQTMWLNKIPSDTYTV